MPFVSGDVIRFLCRLAMGILTAEERWGCVFVPFPSALFFLEALKASLAPSVTFVHG